MVTVVFLKVSYLCKMLILAVSLQRRIYYIILITEIIMLRSAKKFYHILNKFKHIFHIFMSYMQNISYLINTSLNEIHILMNNLKTDYIYIYGKK